MTESLEGNSIKDIVSQSVKILNVRHMFVLVHFDPPLYLIYKKFSVLHLLPGFT